MIPRFWVVTEHEKVRRIQLGPRGLIRLRGGKEGVFTEKAATVEPPWESLKTKPCFPGFDRGELPLHSLVKEAKRSLKNSEFVKSKKKSY